MVVEVGGMAGSVGWIGRQWCRCSCIGQMLVKVEEWQAVMVVEGGGVAGCVGWSGRHRCRCRGMVR